MLTVEVCISKTVLIQYFQYIYIYLTFFSWDCIKIHLLPNFGLSKSFQIFLNFHGQFLSLFLSLFTEVKILMISKFWVLSLSSFCENLIKMRDSNPSSNCVTGLLPMPTLVCLYTLFHGNFCFSNSDKFDQAEAKTCGMKPTRHFEIL